MKDKITNNNWIPSMKKKEQRLTALVQFKLL